jgi:hypothetical protein
MAVWAVSSSCHRHRHVATFNGIAVMGDVGQAFDRDHVWAGTAAYNRWLPTSVPSIRPLAGVAASPDMALSPSR